MGAPPILPVFPLPNIVAFPGQLLHFHIFEPRYRKMVRDIEAGDGHLGVALAARALSRTELRSRSVGEIHQSNLSTYVPHAVFGAGPMRLLKETADGRLLIEMEVAYRARLLQVIQQVPYYRARVRVLPESPARETDAARAAQLYERILDHVGRLLAGPSAPPRADLPELRDPPRDLHGVIAAFFRWFHIDARTTQRILEEDCVRTRALMLLSILDCVFGGTGQGARPSRSGGQVIRVDFSGGAVREP